MHRGSLSIGASLERRGDMAKIGFKPIAPDEVAGAKKVIIPKKVFEAFNTLIVRNFAGNNAVVVQDDVVDLLVKGGLNRSDIFNNHWLDVEDAYRSAGWIVEYDKPGYNESYPATFAFKKPKKL